MSDRRLQLEHEAIGKLLALRQGALATGDDGKRQLELLASSVSTVMVIFRAVERLRGRVPSKELISTLTNAVATAAGVDAAPFFACGAPCAWGDSARRPARPRRCLMPIYAVWRGWSAILDHFAAPACSVRNLEARPVFVG